MDNHMKRTPLQEVNTNTPRKEDSHLPSKDEQMQYNKYVIRAKALASQGNVHEALELNLKALSIHQSEKLVKRVEKMKEYLADCEEEEEEGGDKMAHVGDGYYLYSDLYNKLYEHQRQGVLWMWGLYKRRKGGILGDDMGLGKTIQVIAFLSGLFDAGKIHSVLIVLPVAVIAYWEKEFDQWAPGIYVDQYHGSKNERERSLKKIRRRGGVILTSYGMLVNNAEQLADSNGTEYIWDYTVLDEGHKIKNPQNKCARGAHIIKARNRLMLTGTPVQNNLKEMWALFDWTNQGTLLGTARTFAMEYEQPITRSRQKDATAGEQRLGEEMAASLQKILAPYFLRRTKAGISCTKVSEEISAPRMPTMTRKNDLICWVHLSEVQQRIYTDFVKTDEVKELLNSKRSPLVSLTVLKKICDHPRLLSTRQCHQLGLDHHATHEGDTESEECAASRIQHIPDATLVEESGKLSFLVQLVDNLRGDGHRTLVFSHSRKMLDIIQKILTNRGHRVCRLDGTMRHLYEREEVIKKFSRDMSYSVFLLTTQVGGVGLTLTSADRVVIIDPSWNPATDAQAVDRVFRIGQDKNVVIYRLITCGSVEEKIYRRQIFKDSVTRQTTGDTNNPYRYFSRQELHELFVLDDPFTSTTQQQLQQLHDGQRHSDTTLDGHIAFLLSLNMFGVSDHDLMFSQEACAVGENEGEMGTDYIQNRVVKAQQLLGLEAEENLQSITQHGHYRSAEVFKEPSANRPPTLQGATQRPHPPIIPKREHLVDSGSDNEEESPDTSFHDAQMISPQPEEESASPTCHQGDASIQLMDSDEERLAAPRQRSQVCVISSDEEEEEERKPVPSYNGRHPETHDSPGRSSHSEDASVNDPMSPHTASPIHQHLTSPAITHTAPGHTSHDAASIRRNSRYASLSSSDDSDHEVHTKTKRAPVISSDDESDVDRHHAVSDEDPIHDRSRDGLTNLPQDVDDINCTLDSLALQDEAEAVSGDSLMDQSGEASPGNPYTHGVVEDSCHSDSLGSESEDEGVLSRREAGVLSDTNTAVMTEDRNSIGTSTSSEVKDMHTADRVCSHAGTPNLVPVPVSDVYCDDRKQDMDRSEVELEDGGCIDEDAGGHDEDGRDHDEDGGENDEEEESEEELDEEEEEELDEADEERYIELLTNSKQLYKAQHYEDALHLVLDALEIYDQDQRVQEFAIKLHHKIKEQEAVL